MCVQENGHLNYVSGVLKQAQRLACLFRGYVWMTEDVSWEVILLILTEAPHQAIFELHRFIDITKQTKDQWILQIRYSVTLFYPFLYRFLCQILDITHAEDQL